MTGQFRIQSGKLSIDFFKSSELETFINQKLLTCFAVANKSSQSFTRSIIQTYPTKFCQNCSKNFHGAKKELKSSVKCFEITFEDEDFLGEGGIWEPEIRKTIFITNKKVN